MTPKKKYFLRETHDRSAQDGRIGLIHQQEILLEDGFTPITLETGNRFFLLDKLIRIIRFFRIFFSFPFDATVVVQWPVYSYLHKGLLRALLLRRARIICLTFDIDGLRDKNDQLFKNEIRYLSRFRNFIFNNEAMYKKLAPFLKIDNHSLFHLLDYKNNFSPPVRGKEPIVVFAGNLAKSKFLEKLATDPMHTPKVKLHVYGNPGVNLVTGGKVILKGSYGPEELTDKLEGSFGLVWDGPDTETCSGGFGEYLRYNSPHKLSLYIAAGLPVIIWEQAEVSPWVKEKNIGVSINNLEEIDQKIESISENDYREMQSTIRGIAENIRKGFYLRTALEKFLKD